MRIRVDWMTAADAFAAIALAAVACDGTLGREEAHALRRQLEYRSFYRGCSDAEMGQLFDRLLRLLREQGVQGLIRSSLPDLSSHQQRCALAVAAHLIHADRKVTEEEIAFLDQLTLQVSLPDDEARMVVKAIEALNSDMLEG